MSTDTVIRPERPDQPEVHALLDVLDTCLDSLYAPEACHILDVQALLADNVRFLAERILASLEQQLLEAGLDRALLETGRDQTEAVRLYERCGCGPRGPFGGCPDNGLSVFYEKRL